MPSLRSRLWQPDAHELDPLTFQLMDNMPKWRLRAIERITLSSALWSEREREVHVKPLREVVILRDAMHQCLGHRPFLGDDNALLILPIGDFPKVSQVQLSIIVAGKPVHRVSRELNGELQVGYFSHLAEKVPTVDKDDLAEIQPLLKAIFTFNPGVFSRKLEPYQQPFIRPCKYKKAQRGKVDPVRAYIDGAISPRSTQTAAFGQCVDVAKNISSLIDDHVLPSRLSAAENPVLALVEMFRQRPALRDDQALDLLQKLETLLRAALNRPAGDKDAKRLLYTYFSYGRRWEAFAWCIVPLGQPFTIDVTEKRQIFFKRPEETSNRRAHLGDLLCPTVRQYIAFADAESNHVNIRTGDTSVHFGKRKTTARNELYKEIEGLPDDEHKTREYYARYSKYADTHAEQHRERLWVNCRLFPTWLRFFMAWGFLVATWSAICLVIMYGFIGCPDRLNSADILTILFPVTFGASLLLVQEATTLGRHVRRAKQGMLLFFLLVLWGLIFVLYVMDRIKVG